MKITFNSPVILTFSFLCIAVHILNHELGLLEGLFTLQPEWDLTSFKWYFRLFSNTLGHFYSDGNYQHIMGNLMYILLLGPVVEEKYGSKNTLFMILTTAFVCSIIHLTFSNTGLLGASGIVFMLILLVSLVNFKNSEIPITFILIVLIYIGQEVLGMFQNDNVSHSTHIVGGIVGATFGFLLNNSGKSKPSSSNPMKPLI